MSEKIVIPLTVPFNCVLIAESGSGKTSIITEILNNKKRYLTQNPTGLCILFSSHQPIYESWKDHFDSVVTYRGIPNSFDKILTPIEGGWIVVADDLQKETCSSDEYLRLLISGRHLNVACTFTVWHTVFPSCKNSRILGQNFHSYFLLKSPRLAHQVGVLGGQLGMGSTVLKQIYRHATLKPYSYLLIDQSNRLQTDIRLTVRANCLDEQGPTVCYSHVSS